MRAHWPRALACALQSIIFAGALWYHIIPSAAELIGLHAVHASLLGLHVRFPTTVYLLGSLWVSKLLVLSQHDRNKWLSTKCAFACCWQNPFAEIDR